MKDIQGTRREAGRKVLERDKKTTEREPSREVKTLLPWYLY